MDRLDPREPTVHPAGWAMHGVWIQAANDRPDDMPEEHRINTGIPCCRSLLPVGYSASESFHLSFHRSKSFMPPELVVRIVTYKMTALMTVNTMRPMPVPIRSCACRQSMPAGPHAWRAARLLATCLA